MFELNKFKIITLIIILLFVFAIAAIYSNTKDIVNEQAEQPSNEQAYHPEQRSVNNNINPAEINSLRNRISDLEQKVSDITDDEEGTADKLNCKIQGYMSGDILVPVSEGESLKEARDNGKELVMLCSF